ncbi:MAG: 2-phospho-L-lactate transferase, partial [Acidimicrobiales bacterium]
MITALAGGVGAARFLRGLVPAVVATGRDPQTDVTAIVNTADDTVVHGLHVSPDLDTVSYTLSGRSDEERGWGLAGETWQAMTALEGLGGETWFRLGDRDLATHLYRTERMDEGATLSEVTRELVSAMGVAARLLPMTDDPVRTRLTLADGPEVAFQDYFVRLRHQVAVTSVRFEGVENALPAPGVLDAISSAEAIVICPSNPIVSVGPLLAVVGISDAVHAKREQVVAISPIVAGSALKGPADHLMAELGHESSVVGVARIYAEIASTLVIDAADAHLAVEVEKTGLRCVVTNTVMSDQSVAADLARFALG